VGVRKGGRASEHLGSCQSDRSFAFDRPMRKIGITRGTDDPRLSVSSLYHNKDIFDFKGPGQRGKSPEPGLNDGGSALC